MKIPKAELPKRLEEVEDRFVDLWDAMESNRKAYDRIKPRKGTAA